MANNSILAAFERMWQHVVVKLGNKADVEHNHDDIYYTESEIDSKFSDVETHIDDTIVHITSTERTNWNNAKQNADNALAEIEAIKDGSATLPGVESAVSAQKDGNNQVIASTYIKELSADGRIITYIKGDDTTGTITTQDTTYGAATSSKLGLVKSGTDITVDASGNVSVNDDSHNHIISNVDGLQDALNGKETSGAAASALSSAKTYTDTKISDLINSAPTTLDTLGEIATAMEENADVVEALESAVGTKANASDLTSHTGNSTIHITATERSNWNAAKTHADSAHAPSNAQPNQNAFSNIKVGSTTVAADTTTDTVTFAGSNITITPDATNDKITFSVADGSTSTKGVVQLTNSTSSTSTTTAATPSSVKSAYDLANTAKTAAATAQATADGKANASHTHSKSQITDFPTSMPASDVYSWAKASSKPSYAWSEITGKPSSFTPASHNHTTITGTYTSNGGAQPPSYVGSGTVRFNMMNKLTGLSGLPTYADLILMDTYSGSDVPYVTAIGVVKTSTPRAYIAVGARGNTTTWLKQAELISTENIGSQSVNYATSAGSASSATKATQDGSGNTITSTYATKTELTNGLAGKAASSHNHAASNITSGTLAVARGGTGVTANPSMLVNLGSTSAASVFAASPRPGVTGTLPIANGGTGATTAAGVLTKLGITSTATELNYTDGVTSNIQTQLNTKPTYVTLFDKVGSSSNWLIQGSTFSASFSSYSSIRIYYHMPGGSGVYEMNFNAKSGYVPHQTYSDYYYLGGVLAPTVDNIGTGRRIMSIEWGMNESKTTLTVIFSGWFDSGAGTWNERVNTDYAITKIVGVK